MGSIANDNGDVKTVYMFSIFKDLPPVPLDIVVEGQSGAKLYKI